jgi:hypothetical protein
VFTSIAVQNTSSTASAFVKLRARVGAGDATSGEFELHRHRVRWSGRGLAVDHRLS